ncbi:hypothetical protein [Anabaena lutea]|uniref:hypothetical protein n=1 Tax=Anabaena lutea TaxID=212350 RepID=UPI0016848ABB|nr:hypothetical protein [Anabaena lutea]
MKLPNGEKSEIAMEKLTDYCLNLQKLKYFLASLGQIVFREMTETECERVLTLQEISQIISNV